MKAISKYVKPATIEQAIGQARENKNNFRWLAGGTDVLVNKLQGTEAAGCLIDLTAIDELKKLTIDNEYLSIGSMVRLDDLRKYAAIRERFPALIQAAAEVGSPVIRKTATLGGNILCENRCAFYNQSEWWREAVGYCLKCEGTICIATGGKKNCYSRFVSDTAPVLMALEAHVSITDERGDSIIPVEDMYTGDGLNPRNLAPTGLLRSIRLPLDQNRRCLFKKLRPREAVDFTSLTMAISLNQAGRIRVALSGVDPRPVLVEGDRGSDPAVLVKEILKKSRVVDNDFYSRSYRREMIGVFLNEMLDNLKTTSYAEPG